MIKQLKFQRFLAMVYFGASLSIMHFWYLYFNETLFSIDELYAPPPLLEHHMLREQGYFLLELTLAALMLVSSILLWLNRWEVLLRKLAYACAIAALVLGAVDLYSGLESGVFALEHSLVGILLEASLSMIAVGVVGLIVLLVGSNKHLA